MEASSNGIRSTRAYFAVQGQGVYSYNPTNDQATKILDTNTSAYGANGGLVTEISIASDGKVWLSIANKVVVWDQTTWTEKGPFPGDYEFNVVVDPTNPQRVFVGHIGLQSGKFWRTTNGGASWSTLNINLQSSTWLATAGQENWMTAGRLVLDPTGKQLWFAQGAGVWWADVSNDSGTTVTWVEKSSGIEELVTADIVAPPANALSLGKPVTATLDFHGFWHGNVDVAPTYQNISNDFGTNTGLDYAGNKPNVVAIAGAQTNGGIAAQANPPKNYCGYVYTCWNKSGYSVDGGKTFSLIGGDLSFFNEECNESGVVVSVKRDQLAGGVILVDANATTLLWVPANNRRPRYSTDNGITWTPVSTAAFPYVLTGSTFGWSHRAGDSDKVLPNTFYVIQGANPPSGTVCNRLDDAQYKMMTTTDGGKTFTSSAPLGTALDNFAIHGQVRAVPGKAGHVWVSGGDSGLWESTDTGKTFHLINGVDQIYSFGFGKPLPGATYPTAFAHAKINGVWGIYRSSNQGANWTLVTKYPLGIYDTISVVNGDMNIAGRVYVGFSGNSFAYGDPQ